MADNKDFFSSTGTSNPEKFYPGIVAIRRNVVFNATDFKASDTNNFLALPSTFVVMGIYLNEIEKCTAGTLQLVGGANGATVYGSATVGGNTLAKAYTPINGTVSSTTIDASGTVKATGDMLSLKSSTKMVTGKFEVTVVGFLPDGDSLDNYELEKPYKAVEQTQDNVSADDLYLNRLSGK